MKTVAERIRELEEKEGQIKAMGGAKAVDKQHTSGKLTALHCHALKTRLPRLIRSQGLKVPWLHPSDPRR